MADELWQGYKPNGELGNTVTKTEARNGALHGASHVWIWRRQVNGIEILVQERAKDKLTWPGFLDISAAGHIDVGESPLDAGIRETREEINLQIKSDELRLLFVRYVDDKDAGSGVREREFVWVYVYELTDNTVDLKVDRNEVESVKWLSLDELSELSRREATDQKIVTHVYFPELLAELQKIAG